MRRLGGLWQPGHPSPARPRVLSESLAGGGFALIFRRSPLIRGCGVAQLPLLADVQLLADLF